VKLSPAILTTTLREDDPGLLVTEMATEADPVAGVGTTAETNPDQLTEIAQPTAYCDTVTTAAVSEKASVMLLLLSIGLQGAGVQRGITATLDHADDTPFPVVTYPRKLYAVFKTRLINIEDAGLRAAVEE